MYIVFSFKKKTWLEEIIISPRTGQLCTMYEYLQQQVDISKTKAYANHESNVVQVKKERRMLIYLLLNCTK